MYKQKGVSFENHTFCWLYLRGIRLFCYAANIISNKVLYSYIIANSAKEQAPARSVRKTPIPSTYIKPTLSVEIRIRAGSRQENLI